MTEPPAWAQDVLRQQLAMNPQTWAALQEHEVDESTDLRLDFFYVAPGQSEAEALGEFLRRETDYDVDVHSIKKGMLSKKQWSVTGSTQPTAVSLDILNQWVGWMVAAGAENGGCEFDGLGRASALTGCCFETRAVARPTVSRALGMHSACEWAALRRLVPSEHLARPVEDDRFQRNVDPPGLLVGDLERG